MRLVPLLLAAGLVGSLIGSWCLLGDDLVPPPAADVGSEPRNATLTTDADPVASDAAARAATDAETATAASPAPRPTKPTAASAPRSPWPSAGRPGSWSCAATRRARSRTLSCTSSPKPRPTSAWPATRRN